MSDATLLLFSFSVRHPVTQYESLFLGQGLTIAQAVKDGSDNLSAHSPQSLAVRLPDGNQINMKREDFESGKPFAGPQPEPAPTPKTSDELARIMPRRRRAGV